jgi:hypothetical protein
VGQARTLIAISRSVGLPKPSSQLMQARDEKFMRIAEAAENALKIRQDSGSPIRGTGKWSLITRKSTLDDL